MTLWPLGYSSVLRLPRLMAWSRNGPMRPALLQGRSIKNAYSDEWVGAWIPRNLANNRELRRQFVVWTVTSLCGAFGFDLSWDQTCPHRSQRQYSTNESWLGPSNNLP